MYFTTMIHDQPLFFNTAYEESSTRIASYYYYYYYYYTRVLIYFMVYDTYT